MGGAICEIRITEVEGGGLGKQGCRSTLNKKWERPDRPSNGRSSCTRRNTKVVGGEKNKKANNKGMAVKEEQRRL